ncbi:uncharacterized protein LOC111088511 [Limulus polyphemus]|uniref:Uncharacterized protein LOC111088511 n=1 Tax=Limulus polyphemus TaxID=6850 RepID=A0ABM1TFC5_LIMPO|nr:uncharacterized protein LOC111088511 [Limulus polyphemus]
MNTIFHLIFDSSPKFERLQVAPLRILNKQPCQADTRKTNTVSASQARMMRVWKSRDAYDNIISQTRRHLRARRLKQHTRLSAFGNPTSPFPNTLFHESRFMVGHKQTQIRFQIIMN